MLVIELGAYKNLLFLSQPQNLSRYPSNLSTTEGLENVPQEYIHFFSSPLPEGSDENLLKRSDFTTYYQERPVNLAAVGERHLDNIYPELASFGTQHHSSTTSVNNNYGNNIFTHIFPHNAPESYIGKVNDHLWKIKIKLFDGFCAIHYQLNISQVQITFKMFNI